ncbi:MAG: hypothetical protein IJR59_05750, partial [Firmicutes bacterium]|nr:hypothetical protein [Bacillota bacterium]
MKKKFTSILAILLAVLCTNGVSAAEPPIGDTDCDGLLTASDAAVLLQRILNEGAKMPIEKTRSYMYIADADGDETLTASDAASVMQKVLKPDTKLANDGKTHSQWLERKGADKLKLFEKEVEVAQKVYSASCTYAVDLYTRGQWQGGTKVTFPRLISAGLLEDDYTYYKYRIYTNDDPSTHFIDRVEWETKNSPYGDKGVFPRDGFSDELEIEYGWFNETGFISPSVLYDASRMYIIDRKIDGGWNENTSVDIKDLIKKGYLKYYPETDYRIITENGEVKCIEWENTAGKTIRYPVEYTQGGLLDYEDMFNSAATVFSAAQTYATDQYTKNQWTGQKYIDIGELVMAGLLDDYPAYPFVAETTGELLTPAIKQVTWEIDGRMYRYPGYTYDNSIEDAMKYAAKVFAAAQTYATDLYTANCWSGKTVITTDDLLNKNP